MSLQVPIGIRLVTVRADRRVTDHVDGLTMRNVSPGGYASATINLFRPLKFQPEEVASFARVYFYDTRHAGTLWEGVIQDLGRQADSSGEVWQISAIGPSGHVHDQMDALYYVVNQMDAVSVGPGSYAGTQVTSDVVPDTIGHAAIKEQFPQGTSVTSSANTKAIAYYPDIRGAGKRLARVTWSIWSGFGPSTDWAVRTWVSPSVGVFNQISSQTPSTGDMGPSTGIVGSDWSSGEDQVTFEFQWVKVASGTIGNDNTWVDYYGIVIQMTRMDNSGNELLFSGAYPDDTVTADDIVNDLLGRLLPLYDGPNSFVDTSNQYTIDSLMYPDGTDAGQVLDDLMSLLGTHTWEALETNPVSGLWNFQWRPWGTDVRYDATIFGGYQSPISAEEIYDEVLVRWKQTDGRIRTNKYTGSVDILNDAGFHRSGFIDLSDSVGSQNNADQSASQFLTDHQTPTNSGTLTVSQPILDRYTGRYVQPWEIMAGYLIRIRGVEPQSDLLNVARDGSSICRIVGVDYSDSQNQATLELDSYPVEQSAQIAGLAKNLTNRRRR